MNVTLPEGFEVVPADHTATTEYQIVVKKTILQWYNVYLFVEGAELTWVNLSPDQFDELFPNISNGIKIATDTILFTEVPDVFGAGVCDMIEAIAI